MIISSSKKVVLPEKRNKFSGRYVYLMMLLLTLLPTRIEAQDDGVIWRSTYNEDGVYYLLGKTTNDEDVAMITHGDEPYVQYEFDIKDCIYPYGSPVKVIGIGEEAFMDDNISYIDLPQYLTFIGERAFSGSNLQSIDIPNSVTTIANEAFARCGDLRTRACRRGRRRCSRYTPGRRHRRTGTGRCPAPAGGGSARTRGRRDPSSSPGSCRRPRWW